jgi:ATP-dependent DNA helicase RecG
LIHRRSIEDNRVEFKATWSQPVKAAVIRTVCAFANDLLNLNGGYIVLGVSESGGRPVLPPTGLRDGELEEIQRGLRGTCKRLQPEYQPVLFPAEFQGASILIIWAPGGDNRPYQAPEDVNQKGSPYNYYVRQGSETIRAQGEILRQLMELAAKLPFDDRRSLGAQTEDVSPTLVRNFLHDVRSELALSRVDIDDRELYRRLRIVSPINAHDIPRNVGLIFFNDDPDRFFPGARIEAVQFGDDAGGDLLEERIFRGPLADQLRRALDHLDSLGGTLLQKVRGQAEVERTVPYPYEAMREALVNAVYHRSYEGPSEPVKVYLYPDRMEIISYPGPVAGVQKEHFQPEHVPPAVPARNRRVGEFLKDLHLAETRGTGIPKIRRRMRENGSPAASFDFDEERAYFRVVLPVHPRYEVLHAVREAARLWAVGEEETAIDHLERAFERQPYSGALASQIIVYAFDRGDRARANRILDKFQAQTLKSEAARPFLTMARILLDRGLGREANDVLEQIPPSRTLDDTVTAAVLNKRAGDFRAAHQLFAEAYAASPDDPKIVHEFGQTKIRLARNLYRNIPAKKRLNTEAAELLRRAIQLSDDPIREAWCWFDLARTLAWLRSPNNEVEAAYLKARALLPQERRFESGYAQWKDRSG